MRRFENLIRLAIVPVAIGAGRAACADAVIAVAPDVDPASSGHLDPGLASTPVVSGVSGGGIADPFAHHINPAVSVGVEPRLPYVPPIVVTPIVPGHGAGGIIVAPLSTPIAEGRFALHDDLVFAAPAAPVPAPGGALLFALVMIGRRRRRG